MSEPTSFYAGDDVAWDIDLPGYSADDGWVLQYRLIFATASAVSFTATASGTLHSVALPPATTAAFAAGRATLARWVEKTGQRRVLEGRTVLILANLETVANLDSRSANAIALADARAALAAYLADGHGGVLTYAADGRTLTFRSVKEITDLIEYLQRQVSAENSLKAVVTGVAPGRVFTRM